MQKYTGEKYMLQIGVVACIDFLEDKEAQMLIKMFTGYCQNSSNYLLKDNSKICKLKSHVMKSRGGNRKKPRSLLAIHLALQRLTTVRISFLPWLQL